MVVHGFPDVRNICERWFEILLLIFYPFYQLLSQPRDNNSKVMIKFKYSHDISTHENAQVVRSLQTSCTKFANKLEQVCKQVGTSLQTSCNKYANKLYQVCKQVVTSLQTSCKL